MGREQAQVTCPRCDQRFVGLFDVVESGNGRARVSRADYYSGHPRRECGRAEDDGEWLRAVGGQAVEWLNDR